MRTDKNQTWEIVGIIEAIELLITEYALIKNFC